MIKTVLFDLDGTLLDTEPDFTFILNRLLDQYGRLPVPRERVRSTVSSGARALVGLGFGIDESHADFPRYLEELLALYDETIPQTRCELFRDMDRLLGRLAEKGVGWGIVTNKPSRFTLPLLERVEGLKGCPVVVCRDQVEQAKPHPAGLLLACRRAACAPEEAVYVGDHPRDIEAGRNAGMRTIACAWGYLPEGEEIGAWEADLVAHEVADIEHFLFPERKKGDGGIKI